MSHSPLPWKLTDAPAPLGVEDADGDLVADCDCEVAEPGMDEANAALIVRAVNAHEALLAACEEAIKTFNMHTLEAVPTGVYNRVACMLSDAISLARAKDDANG